MLMLRSVAELQLSEMKLGGNSLTGTLPSSWSRMAQASTITIFCAFAMMYVGQCINAHPKGPRE